MVGKDEAARAAYEAGNFAMQVVGDYGLGSQEASNALEAADSARIVAEAAGCTPEDIKAARRRGSGG